MLCETIKKGTECVFMTKKGCGFNGGSCHTIVEACEGCSHVIENGTASYCALYPDPASKWSFGGCPSASHNKVVTEEKTQKINPLKASKRKNKK